MIEKQKRNYQKNRKNQKEGGYKNNQEIQMNKNSKQKMNLMKD